MLVLAMSSRLPRHSAVNLVSPPPRGVQRLSPPVWGTAFSGVQRPSDTQLEFQAVVFFFCPVLLVATLLSQCRAPAPQVAPLPVEDTDAVPDGAAIAAQKRGEGGKLSHC